MWRMLGCHIPSLLFGEIFATSSKLKAELVFEKFLFLTEAKCYRPTPKRLIQKQFPIHDFASSFSTEYKSAASWSIASTVSHLEQRKEKKKVPRTSIFVNKICEKGFMKK